MTRLLVVLLGLTAVIVIPLAVDQDDPNYELGSGLRVAGTTTQTTAHEWVAAHRTTTTHTHPPRMVRAASARVSADGSVWDRLAQCESNQQWSYNGPSGYDGGLQFAPSTWSAYRPADFPAYAYEATREQQILVAERVLAAQGWRAWPACSRALGLR